MDRSRSIDYFRMNIFLINFQEKEKSYPSRSSSEYGRRHEHPIDFNDRSHVRIGHVKNEFYRNNGVDQKPVQL